MKDTAERYVMVNKAFFESFQMQDEYGLIGKTVFDILPEHDAKLISKLEDGILKANQPILSAELLLNVNGEESWISKTIVLARSGHLLGTLQTP